MVDCLQPVSYTHLDVYKRQDYDDDDDDDDDKYPPPIMCDSFSITTGLCVLLC